MKKTFTFSLLALAFSASAQLPVSTLPQLKNAVLEEYTGIHCVYCPDGHKIASQIVAANPNRAFAVNIHTGGFATPSAGEPDLRTPDGNAIAAMPGTGITGYPQGSVNRRLFGTATVTAMGRNLWTSSVANVLSQNAYVNVAGEATLNATTNELIINVEVYYTDNSPVGTNKLTVMLLQNNINGPQTGGAQFNPSMVNPDGTYRHMHALRDVVTTGATGEDITPTTTGTLITRTINYTVPATFVNVPVDLSNLELVVFVAEGAVIGQKEIINAAEIPITVTGLTTTNNASANTVLTEAEVCATSMAPTFNLKNEGNATLTSANISYSINGSTPAVYAWSGSVAPLGTTTITLPAITYTLNATNTVDINVTSVNGGVDDDPSNNTVSGNFNQTTAQSPTLNITLNVTQDRYGSEITWKFFNEAGAIISSGGPYADLAANGILLHTHPVTLPAIGCYRFEIYDSYGDGINSGYGAGSVNIKDGNNVTFYSNNGTYTTEANRNFGAGTTGIEENSFVSTVSVYPNPLNENATVSFNLKETNDVTIAVTNAIGQVLVNENLGKLSAGTQTWTLNAAAFTNGMYFVEIKTGNSSLIQKISVAK